MKVFGNDDHTLSEYTPEWEWYKARYQSTPDSVLDPEIVDIVRFLGNLPGVIPMWSCEGHHIGSFTTYIAMTVSGTGMKMIKEFYRDLAALSAEISCRNSVILELSHLLCGPEEGIWPVVTLRDRECTNNSWAGLSLMKTLIQRRYE